MANLSCCGTDCSSCGCYGNLCKGCNESGGKVFHCGDGKACAIYECVKNARGYADCSFCEMIPCSIWRETRDPKYTDEEFENSIRERVRNLNMKRE